MSLLPQIKRSLITALRAPAVPVATVLDLVLQLEVAREFARLQSDLRQSMPRNPAGHGFKVYSQADEDGIVEFICRELGVRTGLFAEIGCGDGRENNTHFLLLKGWRGIWVDGNPGLIASVQSALPASDRLSVVGAMVTRENVVQLLRPALASGDLDLLSIDVDGNDLQIAKAAVEAFRPKVVVGEYNAKFPFPLAVSVAYEPARVWQGDDYQGASLAAWVDGLGASYKLVCCNLAGTNAFFVRADLASGFENYTPEQLYQPARFYLTALQSGHAPTLSYLADQLAARADASSTRNSS